MRPVKLPLEVVHVIRGHNWNIEFLGEQYQDIGMLATGLMISSLPIIILYVFLSEQFIKGMTAGALKM